MSLSRLLMIPRRAARVFYNSNRFLAASPQSNNPEPSTSGENSNSNSNSNANSNPNSNPNINSIANEDTPAGYSSIIGERPDEERGRMMRIFSPARNAGQQGTAKLGRWVVEAENPGQRWGNPLMGWTSTRDPQQGVINLERFDTQEAAIEYCVTNGYEYYVEEPQQPKRKPKNYASTFGKNGIPQK